MQVPYIGFTEQHSCNQVPMHPSCGTLCNGDICPAWTFHTTCSASGGSRSVVDGLRFLKAKYTLNIFQLLLNILVVTKATWFLISKKPCTLSCVEPRKLFGNSQTNLAKVGAFVLRSSWSPGDSQGRTLLPQCVRGTHERGTSAVKLWSRNRQPMHHP